MNLSCNCEDPSGAPRVSVKTGLIRLKPGENPECTVNISYCEECWAKFAAAVISMEAFAGVGWKE
jgi:hypothetical protein